MRQWLRPMNDDPIEQAQTALQRAQTALQDIGSETAAPLVEMLRAYEAVLDRLRDMQQRASDMERNLAAQQALLDDRLLRVEHNTVFTFGTRSPPLAAIHSAVSNALRDPRPSAWRRRRRSVPTMQMGSREQASQSGVKQARAISAAWTRQPRLSLILAIRDGRGFAETLHSIEDQVYRNWELCLVVEKACQAGVLPLVCDFEASHTNVRHAAVDGLDVASALNAAAALRGASISCSWINPLPSPPLRSIPWLKRFNPARSTCSTPMKICWIARVGASTLYSNRTGRPICSRPACTWAALSRCGEKHFSNMVASAAGMTARNCTISFCD